jgi:hypothetical protein
VAFLFNNAERNKLWWRVPVQSVLRGAFVYVLWLLFAYVTTLFGVWASPNAKALRTFLLYHWEIWLALGALWSWVVLRRRALLPLIPFNAGGVLRPWFPGDPEPVPGTSRTQGVSPSGLARETPLVGGPSLEQPQVVRGPRPSQRSWSIDASRYEEEAQATNATDESGAVYGAEAALADLAKVEPDLRLALAKCQQFLDSRGEYDTPRARRLSAIQVRIEPDFQRVRSALFAHDTATAIRILTERVNPVTQEIATLFRDDDF